MSNQIPTPTPKITEDERRLLDSMDDSRDDSGFVNEESFDGSESFDPIEMELRRKMLSMLTTSASQGGSDNKHQPRPNLLKKHHNTVQTNNLTNSINNNINQNNSYVNNSSNLNNINLRSSRDNTNNINLVSSSSNVNNNNSNNSNNNSNNILNKSNYDEYHEQQFDTYVTCERQRIVQIADENKWEVVSQDRVLKEYKLYAVEEWIFKSSRLWSAVEYTGNQSDEILVSVVRPSVNSSSTHNKQLQSMLSKAPSGSFYTIRTPLGQLVLANSSVSSHFGLNLIPIPNGNFDRYIDTLKLNLLLKRLSCTKPKYHLTTNPLDGSEKAKFEALSGNSQVDLTTVTNFVKEIQAALSHLNYLPLLTKIDGQYDQKTINAVKAFQIDYNKKNPKENQLLTEGYLDLNTFRGIVTEIMQLRRKIESLGFKTPDNPIKKYIEFNELMKDFQDSYGIYPDAPGKNILTYLENLNKVNHNITPYYHDSDDEEDTGSVKSENILDNNSSFSETESSDGFNLPASPIPLKNKSITNFSTPTSDTSRHSSPSMIAANIQSGNNSGGSATPYSSSPLVQPNQVPHGQLLSRSNKGISTALTEQSSQIHHQQQQHLHQHHNESSPFYNEDMYEYYETIEDAEEKQKLKTTIMKLEKMMETQQTEYDKLKQEFETLSENYSDMKEQAARSMAIISTNDKLFQEIYIRWGKTIRKELPEIEEKINLNVDTIQSCSNRIKRLEDIVISVQKKNERNIFTIITSSLLSIVSMIAVGFAYLIMFFSGLKRKWMPSQSSKPKSSSEEIQRFISKQKIKISELIEDLDYNDQTEDTDKVQ